MIKKSLLALCLVSLFPMNVNSQQTWEVERCDSCEESHTLVEQDFAPLVQMLGGPYTASSIVSDYVLKVGYRMVMASDFPCHDYEIVLVNNSLPDAWSLPSGKIAIHRGLLSQLCSEAELAAVFAQQIIRSGYWQGPALIDEESLSLSASERLTEITQPHLFYERDQTVRDLLATWYYIPQNADIDSYTDRQTAYYLVRAGYDPRAAVTLLERYCQCWTTNDLLPLGAFARLPPPTAKRIDDLRQFIDEFLTFEGQWKYQDYMPIASRIAIDEELYRAAEKAATLTDYGSNTAGADIAEELICRLPCEALFWGILGNARFRQGFYTDAMIAYREAIKLNPNFFDFYLQRSKIYAACGMKVEQINDEIDASLLFNGRIFKE